MIIARDHQLWVIVGWVLVDVGVLVRDGPFFVVVVAGTVGVSLGVVRWAEHADSLVGCLSIGGGGAFGLGQPKQDEEGTCLVDEIVCGSQVLDDISGQADKATVSAFYRNFRQGRSVQ